MSHLKHNADPWPAWATETVNIVPADPAWASKALHEKQQLIQHLSSFGIQGIQHIGSTAVPGLPAKPIIDLITEIPSFDNVEEIAHTLRPMGWHLTPPELDQRPYRRFFIKVEDEHRAVHLQFLLSGSPEGTAQITFRNQLIADKHLREEYAALKMTSADRYGDDREAYTRSKSGFVQKVLALTPLSPVAPSAASTTVSPAPMPLVTASPAASPVPTTALASRIRIIFATNNQHKVEEIQAAIGNSLDVVSLRQAGIDIDIPEPHDTLQANATEKSMTIHRLTGGNCFSEDTGLEVKALNGEPGVKSARYAGEDRAFEKNVEKLLQKLGDRPDRKARFRTVISLILDEKEYLFEGICEGRILMAPAGTGGFGYDPVFAPDGEERSFGEMSLEEKGRYSHRRKAADQLVAFLQQVRLPSPHT